MISMTKQKVIIYSTSWCGFCRSEKQYLDTKNVSYEEKDVEKDEAAQKELLQKMNGSFQGVPVTDIGGDIILGFDRPKIDESLKKHKLIA